MNSAHSFPENIKGVNSLRKTVDGMEDRMTQKVDELQDCLTKVNTAKADILSTLGELNSESFLLHLDLPVLTTSHVYLSLYGPSSACIIDQYGSGDTPARPVRGKVEPASSFPTQNQISASFYHKHAV